MDAARFGSIVRFANIAIRVAIGVGYMAAGLWLLADGLLAWNDPGWMLVCSALLAGIGWAMARGCVTDGALLLAGVSLALALATALLIHPYSHYRESALVRSLWTAPEDVGGSFSLHESGDFEGDDLPAAMACAGAADSERISGNGIYERDKAGSRLFLHFTQVDGTRCAAPTIHLELDRDRLQLVGFRTVGSDWQRVEFAPDRGRSAMTATMRD
jgi:hypothetical protein